MITTTAIGSGTPRPARSSVTSMPSSPGIRMSTRQTSGRSRRASSTAAWPSAACPTTSMSGWASRIMDRPVRTRSWSSATSTRIVIAVPRSAARPRPPTRHRAPARPAGCRRAAARARSSPAARSRGLAGRAGSICPSSVTPEPQPSCTLDDPDLYTRGVAGVPKGVGQRLLRQPVDRRVDLERQCVQVTPAAPRRRPGPGRGGRATPGRRRRAGGRTPAALRRAAPGPSPASPPASAMLLLR